MDKSQYINIFLFSQGQDAGQTQINKKRPHPGDDGDAAEIPRGVMRERLPGFQRFAYALG